MKPIRIIPALLIALAVMTGVFAQPAAAVNVGPDAKAYLRSIAGENKEITGRYDEALAVRCRNGIFVGRQTGSVLSFKGIPFAEQPVGALRWKPPQAAAPSDKVFEAFYFGHTAVQSEWESERASFYPQGEDCLNLNVWVNRADSGTKKPVMVFIHGGSFGWGGTADPLYDAATLSEKYPDVVFVTIAYRTGLLGFMDFSAVEGGEAYRESGNLGLLDQICALEWLRDNVAAFGGDPQNVTIWGESAGGASVSLLPLIPRAKGLFARVIDESGAVNQTSSKEECALLTEMLLQRSGCRTMQDLAALDPARMKELNDELNDYNNFPERDGVVLPLDPYAAYEKGDTADVPMLIGTNKDECRYWLHEIGLLVPGVNEKALYSFVFRVLYDNDSRHFSKAEKAAAEAFVAAQSGSKTWRMTELYNELMFRLPSIRQANANADHGGTVYFYFWEYPSTLPDFGACHAVELSAVFDNREDTVYSGEPIDRAFAETVQQMWVNFARTGDPSTPEHVWEPYDTAARKTMLLTHENGGVRMETQRRAAEAKQLMPLTAYYLHGSYMTMSFNVPTVHRLIALAAAVLLVIAAAIVLLVRRHKKKKRR